MSKTKQHYLIAYAWTRPGDGGQWNYMNEVTDKSPGEWLREALEISAESESSQTTTFLSATPITKAEYEWLSENI